MAIAAPGPGHRPGGGDDFVVPTVNLMIDRRFAPSLRDQLHLGVAKAHRSIVYSHYDYRSYDRDAKARTGRVR